MLSCLPQREIFTLRQRLWAAENAKDLAEIDEKEGMQETLAEALEKNPLRRSLPPRVRNEPDRFGKLAKWG